MYTESSKSLYNSGLLSDDLNPFLDDMMDEDNEETGPWDLFLKSCKDFGCVQNTIVGCFYTYFCKVENRTIRYYSCLE